MIVWHSAEEYSGVPRAIAWVLDKLAFVGLTIWNSLWDIGEGIVTFITGSNGDDLYQRLNADWTRSITTIVIAIIIGRTLYKLLGRMMNKHVALVLSIGYALGSALVVWEIFNQFVPPPEVLIPALPTLGELYRAAIDTGLITVAAAFAAGVMGWKLMKKFSIDLQPKLPSFLASVESLARRVANLGLKVIVGVGAWSFLMMLVLLFSANWQQTLAQFAS